MFGADVTVIDEFAQVDKKIVNQAEEGLVSMAQAVLDDAYTSMEFGGLDRSDPNYESAPEGEPPRWHTGTFRESLALALENGRVFAGSKASDVGLRGAWFEFGGRPGTTPHKKRRWKPHPWLGPAFDRQFDTFVPRVAGTFTGL